MTRRWAHIELYEDGDYYIVHEEITNEYTVAMMREDYAGATVYASCNCDVVKGDNVARTYTYGDIG